MKRSVFYFLLLFFTSNMTIFAALNDNVLNSYLTQLNWTTVELEKYLSYYDKSINDFQSVEELQNFLGTPINEENMNDLLAQHTMDYEELEALLAEYGEEVDDFKFIEDISLHVQFYLTHHQEMAMKNDFLSTFHFTEDEIYKFFHHISQLKIEKLHAVVSHISESLKKLDYVKDQDHLTLDEQRQLISMWQEMFQGFQLQTEIMLVVENDRTIIEDVNELVPLSPYVLLMKVNNEDGEEIATFQFQQDTLQTHLMHESLQQVIEVASIADNYRATVYAAKLPQTAGHYVINMLWSSFLILIGIYFLLKIKGRLSFEK